MHFLVDTNKQIIFGWSAKCGCSHIKEIYWFLQTDNLNNLIPACDVAIGYYIQLPSVNSTIIKTDDLSFLGCNYLGHPCHLNMIEMKYIISCHYMCLNDFDTFTKILNENNYFL